MIDRKEFAELSVEEQKAEMLDNLSDLVRQMAHRLAMTKAIAVTEYEMKEEDFEAAWERVYKREWRELKNKSREEMAMIVLAERIMVTGDISEILEVIGEGDDDE